MQLVILAGGKGTRLGLKDMPKPMCPIAGKPLLERQIELAKSYGVDEVFILSGFMANIISDYFGDGSNFGIKIHHIVEPYPLGTAGSLKLLEGKLNNRFLVFYGDVVMNFDISALQKFDSENLQTVGTLLVHPNNHPYDSDLVDIDKDNNITGFLPKPHPQDLLYHNLSNAAVYVFSPQIFDYIEKDVKADLGKDIFPKILQNGGKLRAYKTAEFIKDMGTVDRLAQISQDVEQGKVSKYNKRNPRPAIFLDRDGTLNVNMDTQPSAEKFFLLPHVAEAIKKINESGYLAIVVTNQPMIAKGFTTFSEVEKTHKKLETLLGEGQAYIDGIYYCPHHPQKGFLGEVSELKIECNCRKPKIGMFLQAAKDFNVDLKASWMIGDSDTDTLAGKNAGCHTLQIGKDIQDLLSAVNKILGENK